MEHKLEDNESQLPGFEDEPTTGEWEDKEYRNIVTPIKPTKVLNASILIQAKKESKQAYDDMLLGKLKQ